MFWLFLLLVMFNGLVCVLAFLAIRRLTKHMRENPEASKLVAEHVIAPLLTGLRSEREAEKQNEFQEGESS